MRKILSLLLVTVLLCMMTACGSQSQADSDTDAAEPIVSQPPETPAPPQPAQKDLPSAQSRILIAYFSLWDNAPWGEAFDASTSASVVVDENGSIGTTGYTARMIQEITGGDIHVILTEEPYSADFDAVVDENHQESSRLISSKVENMEEYDVVFIGYPVWATTLPQAVRTFLSEYDFSGKTVIPFCTHDGYGAGRSFSTQAEGEVTDWLARLGLAG